VQAPEQLPLQLPAQSIDVPAVPVHAPMQEATREPPKQVGGLAVMSQVPPREQRAWQAPAAETDAEHTVGSNEMFSEVPADAERVVVIFVAASPHQKFMRSAPCLPSGEVMSPRSSAIARQAAVTSKTDPSATVCRSPEACAKIANCALAEATPVNESSSRFVPGWYSLQHSAISPPPEALPPSQDPPVLLPAPELLEPLHATETMSPVTVQASSAP
jgi:hypothetical protein